MPAYLRCTQWGVVGGAAQSVPKLFHFHNGVSACAFSKFPYDRRISSISCLYLVNTTTNGISSFFTCMLNVIRKRRRPTLFHWLLCTEWGVVGAATPSLSLSHKNWRLLARALQKWEAAGGDVLVMICRKRRPPFHRWQSFAINQSQLVGLQTKCQCVNELRIASLDSYPPQYPLSILLNHSNFQSSWSCFLFNFFFFILGLPSHSYYCLSFWLERHMGLWSVSIIAILPFKYL